MQGRENEKARGGRNVAQRDGESKVSHERDLWSERGHDLPTCVLATFIVTLRMQIVNRAAYMYLN